MKITVNYSPNFDPRKKREPKEIKLIIFHYTGMRSEMEALNRLTNPNSKVSSHYFIKNNGEILTLIPDLFIAWHAGVSSWKNYKFINKNSIGIEISNPGHDFKYKKFTQKQINSLIKLSKFLIKKYKIKSNLILGHSDISPDRKKDPGERFPWYQLSKKKIGHWHNLSQIKLLKERNRLLNKLDKKNFLKNLYQIGYSKNFKRKNMNYNYSEILTIAFQRRYRTELINGVIDRECLIISENLLKKYK